VSPEARWALDSTLYLIAELTLLAASLCALAALEWPFVAAGGFLLGYTRGVASSHDKRRPW
jgi:hypothetical protein